MRLFIRTEASPEIGMGHFMRCFALAEEARAQDIAVTFLLTDLGEAVRSRCEAIGAGSSRIPAPVGAEADIDALLALDLRPDDWLIFDSYNDLSNVRRLGGVARLLVMNDLALPSDVPWDIVINSAMAAKTMSYGTRFTGFRQALLGPDYALIRREFRTAQAQAATPFIAVMLGGSDPFGLTAAIAQCVRASTDMTIRMIAGPAVRDLSGLHALVQSGPGYELAHNPTSVADALAGAALVVTAAGGTLGEIAAMGLPALALVVVDNQAAAFDACSYPVMDARAGLPDDLGQRVHDLLADADGLRRIAAHAHGIVDGLGPQRILEAMTHV